MGISEGPGAKQFESYPVNVLKTLKKNLDSALEEKEGKEGGVKDAILEKKRHIQKKESRIAIAELTALLSLETCRR